MSYSIISRVFFKNSTTRSWKLFLEVLCQSINLESHYIIRIHLWSHDHMQLPFAALSVEWVCDEGLMRWSMCSDRDSATQCPFSVSTYFLFFFRRWSLINLQSVDRVQRSLTWIGKITCLFFTKLYMPCSPS